VFQQEHHLQQRLQQPELGIPVDLQMFQALQLQAAVEEAVVEEAAEVAAAAVEEEASEEEAAVTAAVRQQAVHLMCSM
jgi:hypothetical protein